MSQSPCNAKHTPGSWHYHGGAVYLHPFPDTSVCIANMDREEPATAPWERDANARLIAAAPDLLEALKDLVAQARKWAPSLDRSRAGEAIAKAEGSCNV